MAQGKLKVKTKLPEKAKSKNKGSKGSALTKRANCPIKPKKTKIQEAHKLKQLITKTVNKAAESEIRSRALDGKSNLSKIQQAVAAQNHVAPGTS